MFAEYYQVKSQQAFANYNTALDLNDEKAASKHMTDYLNYQERLTEIQAKVPLS